MCIDEHKKWKKKTHIEKKLINNKMDIIYKKEKT